MSRFDKAQERQKQAEAAATPKTNGKAKRESNGYAESSLSPPPSTNKRKADDSDELSEVEDSPKPKKVKKEKKPETDEEMARRLAQEENSRSARSTRGGGAKRKAAVTKAKKPKKKSSAKVNSDDDSAVESGDKPVKERKGGFHVRESAPCKYRTIANSLTEANAALGTSRGHARRVTTLATTNGQTDMGICQVPRHAGPKRQTPDPMRREDARCLQVRQGAHVHYEQVASQSSLPSGRDCAAGIVERYFAYEEETGVLAIL